MSVREYIGARYVPIFVGEWDNTQTYEPLSIVQYQGNSYTSRQYVPAGVAIANDAYWAETGNFNAQIEAYREEVQQFDGRLDDIEANGWVTSNRIASGAVGYTQIADGAISPSKLGADSIRRTWSHKLAKRGTEFVFFGDSYGAPGIDNSYDAYMPKRINAAMGTNLHNFAIAGAGWARPGQTIAMQQTRAENGMTDEEKLNTSVVVAMLGCNDLLQDVGYADIVQAVKTFCTWANSTFPYADVYIVPFDWGFSKLTIARNYLITNVMNAIFEFETANVHIIPYAWIWNLGVASRCRNEVHPSELGYRHIAAQILSAIDGGGQQSAFGTGSNLDLSSISGINSGHFQYNLRNGILHINGYIRPATAGAHNINIRGEGNAPAIVTPNDSLFVLPLQDSTKLETVGNLNINKNGSITAYLNSNVGANDVCCFNASYLPEVGVNWTDYVS